MGLFERLTAKDASKISVHAFGAMMREVTAGRVTSAQLIAAFNLDAEAQTELQAVRTRYQAGNSEARSHFLSTFEDAFILAESGFYNKAQVKTALGF